MPNYETNLSPTPQNKTTTELKRELSLQLNYFPTR